MKKLTFVSPNDPILNAKSHSLDPEELKDPGLQELFDQMLKLARGEQTDSQKHILVGLAAPQVGFSLRIILVDVKADGKGAVSDLHIYINPEILSYSSEKEEWYEGCYSTGSIKGIISRSSRVTIRALDRFGNTIEETHTGYVARIFQHEMDHLNGIRFPEKGIDVKALHLVKAEEMPQYRNKEGWRKWSVSIPKEKWKNYL